MRQRRRRGVIGPRVAATFAILVVVALIVESVLVVGLGSIPILQVRVSTSPVPPHGLAATFSLAAGLHPVSVHVGLVPGSPLGATDPVVLVFADQQYRPLYAAFNDVYGVAIRLSSYLTLEHSNLQVQVVDAPNLPNVLTQHPHAFLVMAGTGIIPDSLFSLYANQLPQWIRGGGMLIWAGGPLAYFEGHPTPGVGTGFAHQDLGWNGQVRLVGYDLTDPWFGGPTAGPGPVTSSNVTYTDEFAQALGVQYSASPAGANLTSLAQHNGVGLGFVGASPNGSAPRTSLAWVPVGSGGVFFFGGAIYDPAIGSIPQASVQLAEDIDLLVSLNFRPAAGVVDHQDLSLSPGQHASATLSIPNASSGAVAVVHSEFQGSLLFWWGDSFPSPGAIPWAASAVLPASPTIGPVATGRRSR